MPVAYVAGPMRGYDQFNFPAFDNAARCLRRHGWEVLSPAEHDRETGFDETLNNLDGFDLQKAMRWDIQAVLSADVIVLLPGWRNSHGTSIELTVARAVGVEVFEFDETLTGCVRKLEDEPITAEAYRLVGGDRRAAYGHPREDFTRTGRMWAAILGIEDVPPQKVGLCMAALKISRECNAHKRDNLVDLCGYAQTVAMIHEP